MVGQTISHYRIFAKIGEGGMGTVYKAQDTSLDRIVALKFLSQGFGKPEEKARFFREAQAAAALQHPNICPIYEIDEADGRVFFAMTYVEGKTVSDLAEEEPLSFDDAVSLARQVAAGLEEAHEHGIVHRDIKSENIIVNAKGRAVILDFGLARHKGKTALTQPGVAMGTAPYMSPEQARGDEVDARTDLWALGVVLYEALTGSRPFDSGHHLATLYSIINEDPPPVRDLRPDIPLVLEHVIEKALAKKPDERWQTASEILAELGGTGAMASSGPSVTSARPALPRPATLAVTDEPPTPRRPWGLWAGGLAAALALAYVGWAFLPREAAPAPARLTPDAKSYYDQGQYYLQRYEQSSNIDLAIDQFEKAKSEDPDSGIIQAGIAEAYYRKYISMDNDRKWLDGALNAADRAIDLDANAADGYAVRGFVRNARGQSSQAVPDFEKALDLDPEHVDATRGIAEAYAKLDRKTEAEEYYKKALQLAPGDWTGYKSLGIFYASSQRYEEAEEQFRQLVRLTPDNALGHSNLGAVQFQLGKIDEAAASLERSISIEPLATAYSNLGTARFFQRRYADSVDLYRQAVELRPIEDKYWGNLGDAYRLRNAEGDPEKAKDAYERAIELVQRRLGTNPTDAYRRALLAYWNACLGNHRDAQSEIQQALSLAEDNSDVQFNAALAHEIGGRRVAAREALARAVDAGYPRALASLHPDLRGISDDAPRR